MATKPKSRSKPVAKTSARRTRKAKAAAKSAARPRKAPIGAGPVTLDEARALARARQPKRALRRAPVGPPATPATVGEERERLEQQQRAERERRMREYSDMMEIMKRRGARRAAPKGAAKGRRRAPGCPGRRVPAAAGVRGGRLVVRLSAVSDQGRHHSAPREPARRSDPEPGQGRRRSPLHARSRAAPAPCAVADRRLPGGRTLGCVAVLRRRQRHRRQSDGAVGARLQIRRFRPRLTSISRASILRSVWCEPDTKT